MELKFSRLQYPRGDVGNNIYMFTANSMHKNNGNLVMGAGCAKTVRDSYTGIDKLFGAEIDNGSMFGVKFIKYQMQVIGAFQTKIDWKDTSTLMLVDYSTQKLKQVAQKRMNYIFHLPYPAVTNGHLEIHQVQPIIEQLPDNVIIYLD